MSDAVNNELVILTAPAEILYFKNPQSVLSLFHKKIRIETIQILDLKTLFLF